MIRAALEGIEIPPDFDSYLWRLVLSPRLAASLIEIERDWTLEDAARAHEALDVFEDVETAASEACYSRA